MDSILKQLYLLFGISDVIFTLTGIAIGYSLGVWKSSRFYKKYIEINAVEKMKSDIKGWSKSISIL